MCPEEKSLAGVIGDEDLPRESVTCGGDKTGDTSGDTISSCSGCYWASSTPRFWPTAERLTVSGASADRRASQEIALLGVARSAAGPPQVAACDVECPEVHAEGQVTASGGPKSVISSLRSDRWTLRGRQAGRGASGSPWSGLSLQRH
jgi:hypothetical protein